MKVNPLVLILATERESELELIVKGQGGRQATVSLALSVVSAQALTLSEFRMNLNPLRGSLLAHATTSRVAGIPAALEQPLVHQVEFAETREDELCELLCEARLGFEYPTPTSLFLKSIFDEQLLALRSLSVLLRPIPVANGTMGEYFRTSVCGPPGRLREIQALFTDWANRAPVLRSKTTMDCYSL